MMNSSGRHAGILICTATNTGQLSMDQLSLLAIALAAMVVVITTLLRRRWSKNTRNNCNLPPGPRPWPVIGNLNLLGPLTHRSLHALSLRHGPLMTIQTGSVRVVVGSSADAARALLKTHDEALVDRPMLNIGRHMFYGYSDMFWAPYGAYWRQARKLWHAELLGERQLRLHEHVRCEEVNALLRTAAAAASSAPRRAVAFRHDLLMLNLNVVSRMVMGRKYVGEGAAGGSVATPAEFRWMIDELFIVNGSLNLGDVIPWLNWLDLQGYIGRTKRLSRIFDRFLEHVLDEHVERRRREGDGFVPKDMTDLLLQLADDPNMEVPIKRDGVKGFILDTLGAGTDTSAVTIEWALSELLKNPKALAMATEELDRVVGRDRLPTEGDVPSLPFLQAVIKESMRLHPATPLLSPRRCRRDVSVGGYTIPAGTCVAVNAWAIGRDPSVWEAPDEFRPERFLGSRRRVVDVKGQDFEMLPFGSGRRMCPGMGLGLKMVQLTLANLIHAFAWSLPDGMTVEELNMEETLRFTMPRKVPLEAVPEPKLPAHLYSAEPVL
ncbi:unnamed protein product [Urochloa decumbens]|uniref:trimethyltridecatetraene synthase n=1 Tax=Urochloa decumbens TaxID=240449 RepID=A0ABC9D9L2_9POAL